MMIKTGVFCGYRMRQARIMQNIELDELSEETGLEKKDLWCFENGKKFPTKNEEKSIAKVLEIEPVFFYWCETAPLTEGDINFSPRMRRM
jgi:transcriptional regulator with XRE-family HTH domain